MQIFDLVNQFTSNNTTGRRNPSNVSNSNVRENALKEAPKGNQTLASLQKGQVFEGSVTQMKDGKVVLSLSNGDTVTARLAEDVAINEGESVFFEVKSNEGSLVNIHPVSIGANSNPILMSALTSAGLANNDHYISMVDSMMKEQLPIDSKSLGEMASVLAEHPDTDMGTLITMKKAGIPLTNDMIQQFSNYKVSEGAMLDTVSELLDGMEQTFLGPDVTAQDITVFAKNLMSILTTEEGIMPPLFNAQGEAMLVPEDAIELQSQEAAAEDAPSIQGEEIIVDENVQQEDSPVTVQNENAVSQQFTGEEVLADNETTAAAGSKEPLPNETASPLNVDGTPVKKDEVLTSKDIAAFKEQISGFREELSMLRGDSSNAKASEIADNPIQNEEKASKVLKDAATEEILLREQLESEPEENGEANHKISVVLSEADRNEIAALLEKNGISTRGLTDDKGKLNTDLSTTELVKQIIDNASENDSIKKENLTELFTSKSFTNALKDAMQERWTISPEKVADKEAVKELYAKISVDMERLSSIAQEAAKGSNPISHAADSIRSNVDFINQINQAYTYIQLPLNMSGGQATGDLYVFSNKKRHIGEDDELSAFLHFDLVHLGSTDISVKLKQKKVSTDFYMSDDESFALVQKNLPILQEKLEKLGYSCELKVSQDEETVDFVDDFIKRGMSAGESIHRYSFDMMA